MINYSKTVQYEIQYEQILSLHLSEKICLTSNHIINYIIMIIKL